MLFDEGATWEQIPQPLVGYGGPVNEVAEKMEAELTTLWAG